MSSFMRGAWAVMSEAGGIKAWLVCLSAGLFFFYEFIQLNSFDVLNPILRSTLSIHASNLSVLSSAFLWANIIFLVPAGLLLDHYSVRRVSLLALLICVLGTALIASSSQFEVILLGRFLSGIGNAFCFLACVILVTRWFEAPQRGLVMGLMVTLAFIGGMIAHTPFAYLIEVLGWRSALWVDVFLGLTIVGWIAWQLEDAPKSWSKPKAEVQRSVWRRFSSVLTKRYVYLAGLYTSLLNLPVLVLCALWGGSYLHQVHAVSVIDASKIVSCLFLGSMLGSPLLGYLSDVQKKRKPLMWFGILGSLLSYVFLIQSEAYSVFTLSAIFFSLGFFSSSQVLSYPLLAESSKPHQVGEATSVASLIIMGGGAVGQLLFGWLIQQHQAGIIAQYTAADYQYAMRIFPIAFGLAAVALWGLRETYCLSQIKEKKCS